MAGKLEIYLFIGLIIFLTFLCWKDPSKEKIFCYFVSLIVIQIVVLKFNKLKYTDKLYK